MPSLKIARDPSRVMRLNVVHPTCSGPAREAFVEARYVSAAMRTERSTLMPTNQIYSAMLMSVSTARLYCCLQRYNMAVVQASRHRGPPCQQLRSVTRVPHEDGLPLRGNCLALRLCAWETSTARHASARGTNPRTGWLQLDWCRLTRHNARSTFGSGS